MRHLVDEGWSPSVAAAAILSGEVPATPAEPDGGEPPGAGGNPRLPSGASDDRPQAELIERFVDGAMRLDGAGLEATLDSMFATGSFEVVADRLLLPALVAIGDAWAEGRLGVQQSIIARMRATLETISPGGYAASCAAVRDMDQRHLVGRIRAPTLVIAGTDDLATPAAEGRFVAEQVPHARYVEVPAAHLSNVQAAPAFTQALLQFLTGRME